MPLVTEVSLHEALLRVNPSYPHYLKCSSISMPRILSLTAEYLFLHPGEENEDIRVVRKALQNLYSTDTYLDPEEGDG